MRCCRSSKNDGELEALSHLLCDCSAWDIKIKYLTKFIKASNIRYRVHTVVSQGPTLASCILILTPLTSTNSLVLKGSSMELRRVSEPLNYDHLHSYPLCQFKFKDILC